MKRADLSEHLQTRFGMRLQEGGAKKQEEQKEWKWKDEWQEWDLEETVEPVVDQRFVIGRSGERLRVRKKRREIVAEEFDDLGFAIAKEPFCAFEDTADSPIACIKDAECEETMATQGHSNQDAESEEEWLDEGVPVVW